MAIAKHIKTNQKIAEKAVDTFGKIEAAAVGGYAQIESAVMEGYTRIEDAFVDRILAKDGETVKDAKKRLKREQQ